MTKWINQPKQEIEFFLVEMHEMSKHLVTEPKLMEMDKKLIINIAPNGATISHLENPYILREPEPIIEETIECYKAGASVWHTHLRVNGIRTHELDNYLNAFDTVAKDAPDLIYSFTPIADLKQMDRRQISPIVDPLMKARGRKYCEMILLSPITYSCGNFFVQPMTEAAAIDQVIYCQDLGLKPEIQTRNLDHMARFQRFYIDSGILKKPYVMNVCSGTHDAAPTGPNPWGLINMMMLYNAFPKKDICMGLVAGGRNWLPIVTAGITLGVDSVRIGMEEPIYMYPHKDEIIKRNVDVVKKVTAIAKELGRDIATPAEARKAMGIKPPDWLKK
jgi:3-keto-5-aminohexanoate cleavage enzyme